MEGSRRPLPILARREPGKRYTAELLKSLPREERSVVVVPDLGEVTDRRRAGIGDEVESMETGARRRGDGDFDCRGVLQRVPARGTPLPAASRWLLPDEEGRTVGIYPRGRWLGGPVGHEVFGCNHPLLNAIRRSRTVAADAQYALAPVGILDSQNRVAVSPPQCRVDQINHYTGSLKICELPTGKTGHGVCAATSRNAAREGFPCATTCGSAGCPAACGRDEGSAAGEFDRVGRVSGRECY